jgi:hypothetical protein
MHWTLGRGKLFLMLMLIVFTNKCLGQQYLSEKINSVALLIKDEDSFRIISDSLYGGQIFVEAELDTINATLQFKRFLSGTIFSKKLNSHSFGYDSDYNKNPPQEFQAIKPEIEKSLKLIKVEIPKDDAYEIVYRFTFEVK